jgi:hypothetical protein
VDQVARERVRREIEDAAKTLVPGGIRRVEWLEYGDDSQIEPGEIVPRFVLPEPPAGRPSTGRPGGRSPGGRPQVRGAIKALQDAHGPAIKNFQRELVRRWPEIRRVGIAFEDGAGQSIGSVITEVDDRGGPGDITPVMVRLKPAELEIVDTLISAGIANSRAEVVRWVLTRLSERPAYAELRQHIRDISRLTSEL